MKSLRTPDDRFANLPGYPFAPHYTQVPDGDGGELRLHHIDEGPREGAIVLCMHGEPSWSYLYRKMAGPLTQAGLRVLAPDLAGFGRSDKPASRADYTYQSHVDWMTAWLHAQEISDITLVCQDWGGLIGLRLVAENPGLFARVVTANTFLPDGSGAASEAFLAWQKFSQDVPDFPTGDIIDGGCTSDLSDDVKAAYDAPYPDETYKEGARQFPLLVPTSADDPAVPANLAAWKVLSAWEKPWLTAFSDQDAVTAGLDKAFQERVPGTKGQAHTVIKGGGHFLQEDKGEELAAATIAFIAANPL